jgi:hypothetical protein
MRELFVELAANGAAAVRALRGRSESLDFDCKRKSRPEHGSFDKDDRKNLGITLSAFCNSIGGLLLWGVDARTDTASGTDIVSDFYPIVDIRRFESEARTIAAEALMPRVDNVETLPIEDPIGSGKGYLAMYVHRSERRPHRCEVADSKGYYRRSLSSSRMMEHYEIEDAFRRLSVPELSLHVEIQEAGPTSGNQSFSVASVGISIYLKTFRKHRLIFLTSAQQQLVTLGIRQCSATEW